MDRVHEYLEYLSDELHRPPATVRNYRLNIQRLERFLGKPIWEVTSDDLRHFKRTSTYAPRTNQVTIATTRSYHRWEALSGYCELNGIMHVHVSKVDDDNPRPPLPLLDAWRFLRAAETPSEIRVTYLPAFAGARISGASLIGEEHWGEDRIRWREKGRWRDVPIHPELAAKRDVILEAPRPNVRALEYALNRLKKRTGIFEIAGPPRVNVGAQAFRRTFATVMLDADIPLWMVEGLMGHKLSSMTLRAYATVPLRRKQAAINVVEYGTGQLSLW